MRPEFCILESVNYFSKVVFANPGRMKILQTPSPSASLLLLAVVALAIPLSVAEDVPLASKASQSALVADSQTMFLFEVSIAVLVGIFVIVFSFGTITNIKLARTVGTELKDILSEQFVNFGTVDGKLLLKDGQACYWFYATGRRYTSGLTVFMDLAKRMDIFSYTSHFMGRPQKDRCIFFLPLTNDFQMAPMSLFLVRKKELLRLRELQEGNPLKEVEALGADVSYMNDIPGDFLTMAEHGDIVSALLPNKIRRIIRDNAKHLISMHITDNGADWEPQSRVSKRMIRIEFTLPIKRSQIPQVLEGMATIGMHLVDAAAETVVTSSVRKKALDLRKKATMEEDRLVQKRRAEEAADRRVQKKKEEEEAVGKMSREKQLKYEEKKRKKELATRIKKATRK